MDSRGAKTSATSSLSSLGLNEQQMAAATCPDSDILVLAGAGTGKTKTIVARAISLLRSGVLPQRILLMTFTRRAAREMRHRIESVVGEEHSRITAGTFHHMCLLAMRRVPALFSLDSATVIDRDDAENLFQLALEEAFAGRKNPPTFFPRTRELYDMYSYARNTSRDIQTHLEKYASLDDASTKKAMEIFALYGELKKRYRYLDFDDILCLFAERIHAVPEASRYAKGLYDHILVDEMQDTNPIQWRILEGMRKPAHLFCVGDDAQSIYAFRGADFRNVHSFKERIPEGTVLKLETNYRSTQRILDFSNWLLRTSPLDYGRELKAFRGDGLTPQLLDFFGEFDEARWIVRDVLAVAESGASLADIMILTRTAWRSRTVEAELISAGIPYVFIGGMSITRTAHVRDVFSLLRASVSNTDRLAWLRYLMLWKGIGDRWAARAFGAVSRAATVEEALRALPESIPPTARGLGIVEKLADVRNLRQAPAEAVRAAIDHLEGLLSNMYDNWEMRKRDLELLAKVAERYADIESFLERYTLDPITRTQIENAADESLTLITVHSAKGTEAKVCYIVGVEPGLFPHLKSCNDDDDVEEERRVLYVAMTRAKDRLVLTRATLYPPEGHYFLMKVPAGLCDTGIPEQE